MLEPQSKQAPVLLPDHIQQIMVGVFDIDGVFRGKRISKEKFLKCYNEGFGFCDVVLGWDIADKLYENTKFTGWHTGYPDAHVTIVGESERLMPLEENTLLFLCEFQGTAAQICPRQLLKRLLKRASNHNLFFKGALEYEFFLFDETPNSLKQKGYQLPIPFTPGNFGYSILRQAVHHEFHQSLLELAREMNFEIEGLHSETGPGVLEAAIGVDKALYAADKGALFKTFCKVLAQKQNLMATFMARWSHHYPGQSGHVHLSIVDQNNESVFYNPKKENHISDTMLYAIGGLQQLMPEFTALYAPTINSYTRLVPGFWAPTHANWGIENRTCAIRAIPGSPTSQRIEFRAAGADANPYLALSCAIGAMIWGIENKIKPSNPIKGNAYEQQDEHSKSLPRHLLEAAGWLADSKAAVDLFGQDFVSHFSTTREWEFLQSNQAVTDWQIERYFEAI